jgi:CysZ protein
MLAAASQAFADILTPPFRSVLLKSLAMTIGLLVVLWLGLQGAAVYWIDVEAYPWIDTVLAILTGVGFFVGLGFLVAPITSLLAGLFADEVAEVVERTHYPADPPGRSLPFAASLVTTLKFTGVVILGNIVALLLLLVPGVNIAAFFLVNGYLLGREYFEAAAMRFRPPEEARALRRRHGGTVFLAGLIIALVLAVPIVNLVTPLFATAFMAHLHKRLASRPT